MRRVDVAVRRAGAGADVGAAAPARVQAGLERFNALPAREAEAALAACCASRRWAAALAAARPFAAADDLYGLAAERLGSLEWPDIREAVAAHPRIGERATGPGRDAAWSRAEQAAAQETDPGTAERLATANAAYEARFGHAFLIRAAGRTAPQMLAAALRRLENDEPTEQAVVRDELTQITRIRLGKLLLGLSEGNRP